jgi:hypothetical protein
LDTHYSLVDLMDAHEALDVSQEAEEFAAWQSQQK